MSDDIPPRLPPRYSSLPRRYNNHDRQNGNAFYDGTQPGPSFTPQSKPAPFARDHQHQLSIRSAATSVQGRRQTPPQSDYRGGRTMGNGHSTAAVGFGEDWPRGERPNGWMTAPPTTTVSNNYPDERQSRPHPTNRRTELELASESPLLPEGLVNGRPAKKRKSIRKRIGSFLSFTIRTVVNAINGTSEAERRNRAAEQNHFEPPKRTQSLTRIDIRRAEEREESHRRTQSVRVPRRREEEFEMPRQAVLQTLSRRGGSQNGSFNQWRGLSNLGNTCYLAAAVQALRCVLSARLRTGTSRKTENRDDTLEIVTNLYATLDNRNASDKEIELAFDAFVKRFCLLRQVSPYTEQDDASLVLADMLHILHTQTKFPLPPPTDQELFGLSPLEEFLITNKASGNSLFNDLVNSAVQTHTLCFDCGLKSTSFHDETMIPCCIPPDLKRLEDSYGPQRVNFVRFDINGICQNIRAHLPRYPSNVQPRLCELKSEVMDHDLIELFDLERTEMFTFGRDGWDRIMQRDDGRERGGLNEHIAVVEFPKWAGLFVIATYGGDTRDYGPLCFKLSVNSTVQELREKMRDYLRAFHPFTPDVFMRRELLPHENEVQEEINLTGTFGDCELVRHNIRVHQQAYPHLPNFIRVTVKYDVSAVKIDDNFDAVSIHRSAADKKNVLNKHNQIRVDIPYLLNHYMHATTVPHFTCDNGHSEHTGQITSYIYLAEYLFIQIRRVTHCGTESYKIRESVYVPPVINIGPCVNNDFPDSVPYFEMPRRQRPRYMYELCSVISHDGVRSDSGHYVTFIYNSESKTYTKMNDLQVNQACKEMVCHPFVVIYRRKPEASFADMKYGVVGFAPDFETVDRVAERKAEADDRRTEGEIPVPEYNLSNRYRNSRRSVRFDKSKEPRYHPDREPVDLKSGKKKKKSKK
ncbi:hypothetical protein PFISCL1PPCAC_26985 [Pristionchus fissidentatus]|uniref:Ubiquitin carboxyl-terminal hydrolase n=1 Tax=Pristionchus fissidentatus TaxID=1538716 RepID=A0AAV5WWL8_9BILA|nr:hypothetical protein PFISCL1PPCAC_26985 [Pristionchus fissidentatus]